MILVTGSSGFIGSSLVRLLKEVVPYDIKELHDILDKEQLMEKMKGVDVVIHLAAKVSQEESVLRPDYYYLHNIQGTQNVTECCRICKVKKLVFASSAAAYSPYDNPYALSKWVGEQIVRHYTNAVVLRLFNVYGGSDKRPTILKTFVHQVKEGLPITIMGKDKTRDFIHVDDVCSIIKQVALDDHIPHGNIDVGTGISYTLEEVAELVMSIAGRVPIKYAPPRQDIDKSCAKPVFDTKISLVEGINEILNSYPDL